MSSGHNEEMNGGMGMDVLKHHHRFALVQKISRLLSPDDLAENAILVHQIHPKL
jgi:hypothetical protein